MEDTSKHTPTAAKSRKKKRSNSDIAGMRVEWIDELVKGCKTEADLFGPDGAFTRLKGAVMERLLEAEMSVHLGHGKNVKPLAGQSNRRNGHGLKTVHTETGSVTVAVPRDREGSFEPIVIPKHQRRLEGFDEKVLALYSRGMTMRDIQAHLRELYGTDVSHELISEATEGVMEEMRTWQSRTLDSVYPIVYLDALFVSVRDGGQVKKRAFYVALGVNLQGERNVLGFWAAESEGAKTWLSILTELKQRGVEDIFFVCCDGLTGFGRAVEAAFPNTVVQTCIVHLLRASMLYVAWNERAAVLKALKLIYTAESEAAALQALDTFEDVYGKKHPLIVKQWRTRWSEIVPFLAYPQEIRRILYTTNAIESLNSQLRKSLRMRGPLPSDDAVYKLFYLGIRNAQSKWNAPPHWPQALAYFAIQFEGRMPV
jgi:putative transposase